MNRKPLSEQEEQVLMHSFTQGDQKAFKYVFDQHFQAMTFFTRKMLPDHIQQAQDIVTDTFTKLWIRHSDFAHMAQVRAFLYTASKNACLDHIKHLERLARNKKELYNFLQDYEEDSLQFMMKSELLRQLVAQIDQLPEKYQAVCRLAYIEEIDTKTIAHWLKLTEKTVRNIKGISIQKLRDILKHKNIKPFL